MMGYGMSMVQTLALECSVCRILNIDNEIRHSENERAVLFGAKKYHVCICCFNAVDAETASDPAYRRRWNRWAKKGKTA